MAVRIKALQYCVPSALRRAVLIDTFAPTHCVAILEALNHDPDA
jgi:hypothetical protein